MIPLKRQDDRLLCPVRSLAVCGARRPIKLISPVTLTAAATVSVATEIIRSRTPSELTSYEKCIKLTSEPTSSVICKNIGIKAPHYKNTTGGIL